MSYIKIIVFFSIFNIIINQVIYASHEHNNAQKIIKVPYGLNQVHKTTKIDHDQTQKSQNVIIRLAELRERKNTLIKSLSSLIERFHAGEIKAQYQIAVQISLSKKTLKELKALYEQLQATISTSPTNETVLEYKRQQCAQDWNELQNFLDSTATNFAPCEQIAIDITPTIPNQVQELSLSPLDITTIQEELEEKSHNNQAADLSEEPNTNAQSQAQTDDEMVTSLSSVKNNINRFNIAMREKFVGREMQLQPVKAKQQIIHKETGARPLSRIQNPSPASSHGRIATLHDSERPRYCTAQKALCTLLTVVLVGITSTVIYYACAS